MDVWRGNLVYCLFGYCLIKKITFEFSSFFFNFTLLYDVNDMNIKLQTLVNGYYKDVYNRFDRQLFEALKPPLANMEIVEFTGSRKGDRVHVRFTSPVKAEWVSVITAHNVTEKRAWFTDKGEQLPFPLGSWTHHHIVEYVTDDTARIIDDIHFTGSNFIFSLLLYPAIYLGFAGRKKIYQTYFK